MTLRIPLLLLALSSAALPQDSRPGPADLPSLAASVAGDDLAARRAALKSIARIFDEAADAAAAPAPNNARKHEARLRARAALAAQHGAAMRPLLERGIEPGLLADLKAEAVRSILDALWNLHVNPAKVVTALEGALRTDSSEVQDLIAEIGAFDREGSAATPVLLRLVASRDPRVRQGAAWTLYAMGTKTRGAQEGLVDAFLRSALSSRPESDRVAESRRGLDTYDRVELLQPLYSMGPAPKPLVRRIVAAIESNPEHRYLIEVLGAVDPGGAVARRFINDRFFRAGDIRLAAMLARWEPDPAPIVAELVRRLEAGPGDQAESLVEALGALGPLARSAAPTIARLHQSRPGRVRPNSPLRPLLSTDVLGTELRQKTRKALIAIQPDPDELFRVLSPALATEEDSWSLEQLCEHFDGLTLSVPPIWKLVFTLGSEGDEIERHRAAYLIGRHSRADIAAWGVTVLGQALSWGSSMRWIAARSLANAGPAAARAIPELVEALRDEAEAVGSSPVPRRHRGTRQQQVCDRLSETLGSIGPAARDARPAMMAALAKVNGLDLDATYELAHEDLDRIAPPDRPVAAVVEDATLAVAASCRWSGDNRGAESRPFHAAVSRDPDGRFRLTLFDIRKAREFWPAVWTRALFLDRDEGGRLVATSELWRRQGGPRQARIREDPKLPFIRLRPADLDRAERLELAYDEGDDWIEVTVPNPFRK